MSTFPTAARASRSAGRIDWQSAASGAAAAAGALGASELLGGLLPGGTSLIASVGQVAIDLQPPGAKDVAVAWFGTNDKLALEIVVVAVGLLIGAVFGVLAHRRFEVGATGFAAFGVIGFMASLGDPLASPSIVAVSAAASVGIGWWLLDWLPRAGRAASAARRDGRPGRTGRAGAAEAVAQMPDWSRRSFLIRTAAVGVAATVGGLAGRCLLYTNPSPRDRSLSRLPSCA
jgi:hypothetical protein